MNEINELNFIYKKPKLFNKMFTFYLLLFLIFLLMLTQIKIPSHLKTNAIVNDKCLIIPSSFTDVKNIVNSKYFIIDNKKYNFKINDIGKLYINGDYNLQDIQIVSNYKNTNINQIIEIDFYYENEKVINKIIKGVLQ